MSVTVLVCSNVYPPNFVGGAELIAHYQAKALQASGHDVVVFAGESSKRDRFTIRRDEYDGLPVYRAQLLPRDYSHEFINFHKAEIDRRFDEVLDAVRPDVVHMHNMMGLSLGTIRLAKQRGIPVFVTVHDHWGFCHKNTILKRGTEICTDFSACAECMQDIRDESGQVYPIQMRKDFIAYQLEAVDTFISPSRYLAEAYLRAGVPVGKIRNIWYGIDVDRFSRVRKKPSRHGVRFTFVGYFGPHKGIQTIFEALPGLRHYLPFRLNLAGFGGMEEELRRRAAEVGLQEHVRFWGKVDNHQIEKVYEETDVFVLPSIWPENQPVTITEAMACRTPVIGSRIGGIPEMIDDGQTGFLFQPGDPGSLAQAMRSFLERPDLVKPMGEKAFQKIRHNTYANQIKLILRAYNEKLNRH